MNAAREYRETGPHGTWEPWDGDEYPDCEQCGEPIDYCLGHGTI